LQILPSRRDAFEIIEHCYKERFSGLFPWFLSLSEPDQEFVVINCTAFNGGLVLVDPVTLSVINTIYFNPLDFKMTSTVARLMRKIQQRLAELQASGLGFHQIFHKEIEVRDQQEFVSNERFSQRLALTIEANALASTEEWKELAEFLDQDNNGRITCEEFEFLYHLIKFIAIEVGNLEQEQLSFSELSESQGALILRLFEGLAQLKVSYEEAFQLIDRNNDQVINAEELTDFMRAHCGVSLVPKEAEELVLIFNKRQVGRPGIEL